MTRSPAFESRPADWLGFAEAQARVVAAARPGPQEDVPLHAALGRALLEDQVAAATLPPWDNAGMDGYAARAEDVRDATAEAPVRLRVAGRVAAGDTPSPPLEPGTAVRIMTGAPVPEGADSVVRVERTDREEEAGWVRILDGGDAGGNVRPGGQDMRAGDTVLRAGETIGPGTVAVLAALGRDRVRVARRPEVAILTTGDELRGPDRYGDVLAGRGIPETNGPMLAAAVLEAGAVPVLLPTAPDDEAVLEERLREASASDVIVTVGGASMGDADLVKRALDRLGFALDFWRVRMRPGSPVSFGTLPREGGGRPVFGLPGNPASAFVTFEVFVRPFLRLRAGHGEFGRPRIRCIAGEPLRAPAPLCYFLRVDVVRDAEGRLVATPSGPQGSGLVRGLAGVRGLAMVGEEVAGIEAGESVEVRVLEGRDFEARTAGMTSDGER